jgi:hypothetical protein
MVFATVYERFAQRHPMTLMARVTMEQVFGADLLDTMFTTTCEAQYSRTLLFSTVVDLMTVVVHGVRPSLRAAYQAVADTMPVTLRAVYDKVNGLEPGTCAGLVHQVSARSAAVIDALGGARPSPLPGWRVRIVDGNHLPATERRLEVLRGVSAGPRPGFALVVLDPQRRLPLAVIPVEDAYTQERAVLPELLPRAEPGECWISDRNLGTPRWLFGLEAAGARFIVRQHAQLALTFDGPRRFVGRTDTGRLYVQRAWIRNEDGEVLAVRRVTLRLDEPTRDGETAIHLITNLRVREATVRQIAKAYRGRWSVEGTFLELATILDAEIKPLGYPRAALFGLCVGLASYAVLSVLRAALRAEHGAERGDTELSPYYMAHEIRAGWEGLETMTDPEDWVPYRTMPASDLARVLRALAARAILCRYRKHPRGPKKPVTPRTRFTRRRHVSTQRLLDGTPQRTS